MKTKTVLNGKTVISIDKTTYNILNPLSISRSDDGFFRYIYYIFDHKNNKYYIGQHRTLDIINDEYEGSGSRILEAYNEAKKELKENWEMRFSKCIISEAHSEEELNYLEEKIVNKNVLKDFNSYNAIKGGKTGYKAANAIEIYVYDLNGNLIESFPSISKAALWGLQHINTKSNAPNLISLIASSIKKEKYKSHGYYWVDYEIKDWELFMASLKAKKGNCRNRKNSPVVLIDPKSGDKTIFKNRLNLANWIIENGYSNTDSSKQVLKSIMRSINENVSAYGFIIQNAKLDHSKDIKTAKFVFSAHNKIQETISFINTLKVFLLYYGEKKRNLVENYKFTIELSDELYSILLGTVLLYNTENKIKCNFENSSEQFEFQDFIFKRCNDKSISSRMIIDNVIRK